MNTKTDRQKKAKDFLKVHEGDGAKGLPVSPKVNRKTVDDILDDVLADYRNHGRDTIEHAERRIDKHLKPFFGVWNAASVTDDQVRKYVDERKAANAANATINRELALLKRAYSLNRRAVSVRPDIPHLKENNARKGFFERAQFEAVRAALPAYLQPLLTIAYITGWRIKSELLPMEWRQVDFKARTLRLEPGTTKNDEGREFPFTQELEAALLAQRAHTDTVQKKQGAIIPCVFHRDGERIRYWRRPWLQRCSPSDWRSVKSTKTASRRNGARSSPRQFRTTSGGGNSAGTRRGRCSTGTTSSRGMICARQRRSSMPCRHKATPRRQSGEPIEVDVEACGFQLPPKFELPCARGIHRRVDDAGKIGREFKAALMEGANLLSAQPPDEEAELKDNVLTCSRILRVGCRSDDPADVVWS